MNLVLYLLFTRSLVLAPLAPVALGLLRASEAGTERLVLLEAVVCASHLLSALRSRGWVICWGAEILGRVVFLRRRDIPLLSDILAGGV